MPFFTRPPASGSRATSPRVRARRAISNRVTRDLLLPNSRARVARRYGPSSSRPARSVGRASPTTSPTNLFAPSSKQSQTGIREKSPPPAERLLGKPRRRPLPFSMVLAPHFPPRSTRNGSRVSSAPTPKFGFATTPLAPEKELIAFSRERPISARQTCPFPTSN